jgi:hypothetical protein
MWDMKGPFNVAIEDDEDIVWEKEGGEATLHVLIVGF